MPRAIASLSLSFGLVSIPVKLYSATEASSSVRFTVMRADGARVRQQYVSDATADDERSEAAAATPERAAPPGSARSVGSSNFRDLRSTEAIAEKQAPTMDEPAPAVVERDDMVKGYEFEKGRFVLFTPEELKALREASRQTIDIVSFVPQETIDPLYYDKAYLLAPEKRASKPYSLLHQALRASGRCALAKWAWRSKQYVVQVRAVDRGLVLQQLRYAEEVRSVQDLDVELVSVTQPELQLALQLIEHISEDAFDPSQFVDEEKQRILAAVEKKVAGQEIVAPQREVSPRAEVIDLMSALRASLSRAVIAKNDTPGPNQETQREPPVRATKSVAGLSRKKAGARK